MENSPSIARNSDFLFLYEAIQCNPNGDIDQENKPRMDYDNQINLVTDVRLKRYIRDYLKTTGSEIFVDMEGENKVSPESKLIAVLERLLANSDEVESIFADRPELAEKFKEIKSKAKATNAKDLIKAMQAGKESGEVNRHILAYLVKQKFIDIRFFGSAFAIGGFTKSYIGPIQINWGYSLHKVQLMESNSIVTIMNDGSSTIGKDYRVHYSLLAFSGTVNKHAAISTGLSESDLNQFRRAIWESIPALPTRSKINQYPKLYVEVVYNDGFNNGRFGDLRQYVS
ncbi:MAG TPA: type I CRISPR-associated protein Cas7, partial [Saprospiraceae bacterium]|nr:type I CRISPR-associated protein Cas7 [Saprospiraceae bacterium]